ncbi:MAG: chitobiase/beta-hexosaminidase C-terminal domain-containing protein [Bacteroidales bacterium]|nr:chitobiase/beta-hexosaminidase C-terminal domain-containing protein [Bacteroidales bacterium]
MKRFTLLIVALLLLVSIGWAQTDHSTTYTSNVTLSTEGGTNASTCAVVVSGTSYDGIKAGTGKVAGAWKLSVPAGTRHLHLHVAAWNNESITLTVTPTGYANDIPLTANSGIANNSPFTFNGDPSTDDYYKVITFESALDSDTDLTFTATGGKRFVVFGVNAEEDGGSTITPTTVTIDASNITNTNLYEGTAAGWLSATVSAGGSPLPGAAVTWSSSNTGVAIIDDAGYVTLVATGTTTLTASYAGQEGVYGSSHANYALTVTNSDPNVPGSLNNPYTVEQAREAIDANTGTQGVYATGIVSEIVTAFNAQYGNITYNISDDGSTTADQLQAYRGFSFDGAHFTSEDDVQVGATVVIFGNLKKYGSTYEFEANNQLVSYIAPVFTVEAPVFDPVGGTYEEAQTVTITCATPNTTIHYTTDGSTPDDESTTYTGPITVSQTTTIKAIAYDNNDNASQVATAVYNIVDPNGPGTVNNPYTVEQARAAIEANTGLADVYVHGIVSGIVTAFNSQYGNISYNISDDGTTESPQLQAYRGKGLNNTEFTSENDLLVGDIVTVFGTLKLYNTTYELDQGNYLVSIEHNQSMVAAPTFSPAAGTYNEAQTVEIACATEGAIIVYSTESQNGPWTTYSEPILVETTTTIWAYAFADDMDDSSISSAQYTIVEPVEPQIFSLTAGHTVTEGQTYLIVDLTSGSALTSANGSSSAPTLVAVTIDANSQITTDDLTIQWTFEATDGGYIIHPVSDNTKWLYSTDTNNGVRVGTNENNVWELDITSEENDYHGFKNVAFSRYLGVYNNQDWRAYTTIHNNIKDTQIALFILGDIPVVMGPSITANNVSLDYDATEGTIGYTVNNPVEGGVLTASTEADWITNLTVGETVTFSTVVNPETSPRSATVTLTYTYGTSEAITKNVTVTQAANPGGGEPPVMDPATLPFAFDGGRDDIADITGLTQDGLDSDYNASPKLKFNSTGDYVLLYFDQRPGKLSFDIKGNGFSGSTFTVQTSEDGVTFTELATYTELGSTQSESFNNLGENVRYIKWIYTEKVSGNVALGNIELKAYAEPALYYLTIGDPDHVTITATYGVGNSLTNGDYEQVLSGTEITIALEVEEGYTLESLTVTNDAGDPFTLTHVGETWTFEMPDCDANVDATATENTTTLLTIAEVRVQELTTNVNTIGTVTSINGKNAYIQDATAAIVVYADSNITDLTMGDEISVQGKLAEYNGLLEITSPSYTILSQGNTVTPELTTIAAINADYAADNALQAWLVRIENATVTAKSGTIATIEQDGQSISLRNIPSSVNYEVNDLLTFTANVGCYNAVQLVNTTDVTVTQGGEPPVEVPATLPFAFDGGRSDIATTTGLIQNGLGDDYGSSPKLKFDGAGDYVQLYFDGRPGRLSFDIKGNSFSGGTFTVQTSEDGETFTELAAYTELGNTQSESFNNLGENVRYIKWIYTEKVSGNVALGNIVLEAYAEPQDYTLTIGNPDNVTITATYGTASLSNGQSATIQNGTDVTLALEITAGYMFESLTVTGDDGSDVALTENANGTWTFTMPSYNATVNATATVIPNAVNYTLATTIESGRHYIIANGTDKAMGLQNSNNRAAADVIINQGVASVINDEVYEFVINGPDVNGFYTIYDANEASTGYLFAAGANSNNYLRTQTFCDNKGQWAISFDPDTHAASVVANMEGRNTMRYNSSNTIFSCYASNSTQHDIYLYVKDEEETRTYYTDVTGYGENDNHWHLIASPVMGETTPTNVNNLLEAEYDLYQFDQTAELEEWRNHKTNAFNLAAGKGYLYANNNTVTLRFEGQANTNGTVNLSYSADNTMAGWNLVGNPFGMAASIADGRPFYVMNEEGTEIITAETNAVNPMQGIFVVAENANDGSITFTQGAVTPAKAIVINVSQEEGTVIDRAVIRFDQTRDLDKIMLHEDNTKIYFDLDENEFAVVNAEKQGEMPVCFKTSDNGSYTLSIHVENMTLEYLHLIDSLTGDDIDLLKNPSYTFISKEGEHAQRFRIKYF